MTIAALSLVLAVLATLDTSSAASRFSREVILRKNAYQTNVVGGTSAPTGQFPQLISLWYKDDYLCGGVLIEKSWVLTAAHCLTDKDNGRKLEEGLMVLAGTTVIHPPSDTAVWRGVDEMLIHDNYYQWNYGNDIALLKLSEPMPINNKIREAALGKQTPRDGQHVTVAGWGIHDHDNRDAPQVSRLQMANLQIVNRNECGKKSHVATPSDQICAWSNGEELIAECNGDSGGPLYMVSGGVRRVVGIVSWSRKEDETIRCGVYPGFYTNVASHLNWIKEQTGLKDL